MTVTKNNFYEYMPAYTATNEDWRWARRITHGAQHVLTVAASGDQALTYCLDGATHIDTYDITRCAHVIQDIKTTALRTLSYTEYLSMLRDLRRPHSPLNSPLVTRIIPKLPPETRHQINAAPDYLNFRAGAAPRPENQFTESEYKQLGGRINKTFKFFLGPIQELHTHLTVQYDLVDTSNIFDNMPMHDMVQTLASLTPYLYIGGRIIYLPQNTNRDYRDMCINLGNSGRLEHAQTINESIANKMIIFQRSR